MTTRRTAAPLLTLAATTALAVTLLAGCSSMSDATPAPASSSAAPAATTAPVAGVTAAPDDTSTPAAPVADAYSQVVGGVLYQGSEAAPVRIGSDTPGQPPVLEAQMVVVDGKSDNAKQLATDGNKYIVLVFPNLEEGGYDWKVRGMSQHGSFRDLADTFAVPQFASADEAIAAGFSVDGRALDRSEYMLLVR